MPKKTTKQSKNLFDLVMKSSKGFVEKAMRPIQEMKAKQSFTDMIHSAQSRILELKQVAIRTLVDVKNLNVGALVEYKKEMKIVYDEMVSIGEIYKNVFGDELNLDISEEDLDIDASAILSAAADIEDDED